MKRFLIVLFCILMFSCASKPVEPENDSDSLIVGQIFLKARGFNNANSVSINGKHFDNIELVFENQTTGKRIVVMSRGFLGSEETPGFFYFRGENNSTYELKKMIYKHKNLVGGGSWVQLTSRSRGFVFDISSGKVFNIGKLIWVSIYKKSNRLIQNSSKIKNSFSKIYKESKWNNFKWEDIKVYGF